jgi:serine/threonine-protein kinase
MVCLLIVMFALMMWVSQLINHSTRELSGLAFRSILEGNMATVRLYIVGLQRDAERVIDTPEISLAIDAVLRDNDDEVALANLQALMPTHANVDAWVLTNPEGRVIASDDDRRVGQFCGWSAIDADLLRRGLPALASPSDGDFSEQPSSENVATVTIVDEGLLVVLSPLTERHQLRGAVGWVVNPRHYISESLQINPQHATFIFDRHARILTRSRFEDELLESATVHHVHETQVWQPVVARASNFYLDSRTRISKDASSQFPLSKSVDLAIRGSSGVDTSGYRDYRGALVVGAWQWLPDFELGMAMEMDVAEAYRGMRLFQWLIIGLLSLLCVSAVGVTALAIWGNRMSQRLLDRDRCVRRLGQYELTELLGAGGMGSVYRGRHQYLRRDVAIKVLEGEEISPQAIERFRREVQLTSTLRHPNTIAIYDYGHAQRLLGDDTGTSAQQDGVFYYVMEYVDGISLQQLIDFYGPQKPSRVVHLLLQVCGSIAEAHSAGLIHRDIKPANILLSAQSNSWDFIKVLDFGLVKEIDKVDDTVALTMTRSDSITGTPLYMAPETIRDATQASTASDLYSIGAVGYALLTGQTTYEGDSAIDLCIKQLEQPPLRPERRLGRSLPVELQDLIMSCLSLRPSDRPTSVHELLQRLDDLPELEKWNQADSMLWWETVFEANRQKTPVETKNPTVANLPVGMMS